MKKIFLIGAGGHARSCSEIIKSNNDFRIECYFSDKGEKIFGKKAINLNLKNLKNIKKKENFHIAIGQIKNNTKREKLFNYLKNKGYSFPSIISKKAYTASKVKIGMGTIIMSSCVINVNSVIGVNNIINTGSIIEHDVKIGNHNHVAPGAIINGEVKIGNNCFIGSGAIIKQGVMIEDNCFVQAGKIVLKNLKKNTKII